MTRIDFYVLKDDSTEARLLFVCRLVDKAVRQGNRVFINVADWAVAELLDDLLWSFRPESFIPHALANSDEAGDVPVVLSAGVDRVDHHDLLINLASDIPAFFSRFQRLAEVVVQLDPVLESTRQHYGFFKERGYPIETHKLGR
jgi:DNA polymerase-3 subunit chi